MRFRIPTGGSLSLGRSIAQVRVVGVVVLLDVDVPWLAQDFLALRLLEFLPAGQAGSADPISLSCNINSNL